MRPRLSPLDQFIASVDSALRTVLAQPAPHRPSPARNLDETLESTAEKEQVARLMRVNHAGEIAAQALYHGQAITARDPSLRDELMQAAAEENDHLEWCKQRLTELDDRPSYLVPAWYAGSFAIGSFAGLFGDRWSLGFLAETEKQVEEHLDDHLGKIPDKDRKTRAVLQQMKVDEMQHGHRAREAGGRDLPAPVRGLMKLASRLMTRTAYWV